MDLDAQLRALAAQESLPTDLLRRLLRDQGARGSAALIRKDLTEELIEEIIALGSARSLAANSHVPSWLRARFVEHPEPTVRCAVAASITDEPPGLLARLADDPDQSVRRFLTMNKHLPPDLLARLAADPEPGVRSSVVSHWRDAPDTVRRALLTDTDPDVRRCSARAYVPPADLLPVLLADPATRADAVRHVAPTQELATDPDSDVREAVAVHPDLPAGLRDQLAEDPDIFVRNAIAARADTPAVMRERVVATLEPDSDLAEWMLAFARGHHSCPPAAAPPPSLSRDEAEALLTRAGL
ncbi:hypothetical protein [Streptomyces avidinii]|uniref:Leucine rich repeat (LRR) protein n=1 Tax=Streptomyces avidinii TaxID=1895 RepID=A0ABS4LIE4_STRAV|nr:hypothetical protein [Streptomyces avidinii]MBP2041793.1 hypothetical protein [Streptomyces avidinii]GGZ38631.1 hypothetical protein GCM10010343_76590 [Streptomyces avidinii]